MPLWFHCWSIPSLPCCFTTMARRSPSTAPPTLLCRLLLSVATLWLAHASAAAPLSDSPNAPQPSRRFGLGEARAVALSPDLQWLATGGPSGVYLWDVTNPSQVERLEVPWTTTTLTFSPDSRVLYAASQGSIYSWDTTTRKPGTSFHGHRGEVGRLLLSTDGQTLFSASADNSARLWSTQTGESLRQVRTPGSSIMDLALAPDGRTFATVDSFLTNSVKFWDTATGAALGALPTTNWPAQRCVFTPQGGLVTISADRQLTLWDTTFSKKVHTYPGILGTTTQLIDVWFPNDSVLASQSSDGRVYLWNLASAELLRVVEGEPVLAALGVPGEHLSIAVDLDSQVRLRQLPGGDTLRTFAGHTTSTHTGVAYSPDGRFILSGGVERVVRLWDRATGAAVRQFPSSPAGTATVGFSPDGSQIFATTGFPQTAARLWDITSGALVREFTWSGGWPTAAAMSPDGQRLAVGAQENRARVFDVASGSLLRTFPTKSWVVRCAFSPRDSWLACATVDGNVTIFDSQTGQVLQEVGAEAGAVTALAFSASGDLLLVTWQDGVIRLYSTAPFALHREFFGSAAFLDSAALSPDGTRVLTGESFPLFTATLWDVATGEPQQTFAEHRWSLGAVAFSPDGTRIITGADLVREWSLDTLASTLGIARAGAGLRLTWTSGTLESAPSPRGPWQALPAARSPWDITPAPSEPAGVFRLRLAP